ncbi:MAG: hypothetical protein WCA38_12960, partial [Candidatus Acidiferrales bacterium]
MTGSFPATERPANTTNPPRGFGAQHSAKREFRILAELSQLRGFFGLFAVLFIVKACVFIGALPENGTVETKCLPF